MAFKTVDVEAQYLKDSNLNKEDVLKLMEWVQNHTDFPKITELQAISFLHSNYYNLESAKRTVEKYFILRQRYSHIYEFEGHVQITSQVFSILTLGILPQRTALGYSVAIFKVTDSDTAKFTPINLVRVIDMISMVNLYCTGGISNGLIVVVDCNGIKLGHAFKISLQMMREFINYIQTAWPIRLKEINFVNATTVVRTLYNIARPFISDSLLSMIRFHGNDFSGVFKSDPNIKDILPTEFSGFGPPSDKLSELLYDEVTAHVEMYKWLQNQIKQMEQN